MTFLRSLLFNLIWFPVSAAMATLGLPLLLLRSPRVIRFVPRTWSRFTVVLLRIICGVRLELRGMENIPPGAAVIAAKHQSAFDTIVWMSLVPDAAYVLKSELLSIPIYGWLVRGSRMIPVDRAGGGVALRAMLRVAQAALAEGRQVVIFPEGTRTSPGQRVPYQPGVVAIAGASRAPVVPAATDSGRVWGRRAFLKRPGVIRISVLPPLPPGLPRAELIPALEAAIEGESDRLLAESGWRPVDKSVG
jgi:1-acyl-sn-glycerol-3-phosphate acyltransferase